MPPEGLIQIDFEKYGFLDAGPVKIDDISSCRKDFEEYLSRGFNAGMRYLERNVEKRFNPCKLLEGAQTMLCFLAPYGRDGGSTAGFAQGEDYHTVVKGKLFKLMEDIKAQSAALGLPAFSGRAFVDSAPVYERFWAAKAGLGFIGRNNFLISEKFGLRTIIGEIVCNIPYEHFEAHGKQSAESCGQCGRCREACPAGALIWDGDRSFVDARRCISYHTIESHDKGRHPVDYNGWIFGCEECLKACPWNKDVPGWKELESNKEYLLNLKREDWRQMSIEEFEEHFSNSGFMRSGLEKIKSNL